MKRHLLLSLLLLSSLAVFTTPAHANTIDDLQKLYDTVPADLRPFNFDELRNLLNQCQSGDAAQCIDVIASSSFAQQADLPSWVPMWIKIYFDISPPDYWGLLEDAGEAIACTAANIIFDVDVCGAIQALVDAAKAVAAGVSDAIQFLGDVLGAVGTGLKDAYCDLGGIFGGCDDSSPQPPPEVVAFANFYSQRIQEGVWNRELTTTQWNKYKTQIVSDCSAATGQGAGCSKAYPAFEKAVFAAWDQDIISHWMPSVAQLIHNYWTPAQVNQHMSDVPMQLLDTSGDTWHMNTVIGKLVGMECDTVVGNAGAPKVQDWINLGEAAPYHLPAPWVPLMYPCEPFKNAFNNAVQKAAYTQGLNQVIQNGACTKLSDNPLTFDCTEPGWGQHANANHCNYVLTDLGGLKPPNQCYDARWWWCPQQNQTISTKFHDPAPAGCTAIVMKRPDRGDVVNPNAKCQGLEQEYEAAIKAIAVPHPNPKDVQAYQAIAAELAKQNCSAGQNSGPPDGGLKDPNHH